MELPTFSTLKLQFGHDCRNYGCNVVGCKLCRNNPKRRCQTHFREKYVDNANRVFAAWCKAPILVRIEDAITGDEYTEDTNEPSRLQGAQIELCLLEGISFEQKENDVGLGNLTEADFESMTLLDNTSSTRSEPLLVPGKGCPGEHTVDHRVRVPLSVQGGTPVLVRTSRSSQSAQGGRTRPFRLLAKAVWQDGTRINNILPDVSEPFVVTTRRTQGAEKALVPKWDDPVSKLPGVGKETFSKLKDLRAAGLQVPVMNHRIQTVGQLFDLIDTADPSLLQDLGRTLGLKQDKVAELQQNARTVAREDNRKRVWGSPDYPSDRLLYPCREGEVQLKEPIIEVVRDTPDGAEIISTDLLPPEDQERVKLMRELAFNSWWTPEHLGWGFLDALPEGSELRPVEEPVQTVSLRQQMDRQCRQRRFYSPQDDPFAPHVEREIREQLAPANQYLQVHIKRESREPSYSDYNSNALSVSGSDHCMPGPSVFDTAAYPESAPPEVDPLLMAAREINPNAQDISNVPSAGILVEQPAGLAYISAGPNFERSGPIRIKRSVSGNRYKPMPYDQTAFPHVMVNTGGLYGNPDNHVPPPLFPQPVGVFSELPPKPSRELRTQSSLDKIAFWQQTRVQPTDPNVLGERLSLELNFMEPEVDNHEYNSIIQELGGHEHSAGSAAYSDYNGACSYSGELH